MRSNRPCRTLKDANFPHDGTLYIIRQFFEIPNTFSEQIFVLKMLRFFFHALELCLSFNARTFQLVIDSLFGLWIRTPRRLSKRDQ